MLKVTLFFAGKEITGTTLAGLQEYKKRLSKSCQLDWKTGVTELPDASANQAAQTNQAVLLDRAGQSLRSPELASQVQAWMSQGKSQLSFYIGQQAIEPSPDRLTLSLSPAALSTDTAGLLMAEQLYRVFRILEGKQYHK